MNQETDKKLESWLKKSAESSQTKELLEKSQASVGDELLARYRAGLLSEEETSRLGINILLSESAAGRLAAMEDDMEAAIKALGPAPRQSFLLRILVRLGELASSVMAVPAPVRVLAVASVAALAIVFAPGLLDRPPPYRGDLLVVDVDTGSKGIEVLPDGTVISLIDRSWMLQEPTGTVERVKWFVWQPVQEAQAYSLELRDGRGGLIFRHDDIGKAWFKLPSGVSRRLEPASDYIWIVEAVGQDSRVLVRGVGRFRSP